MSAILVAVGAGASALDDGLVSELLSTMSHRGSEETAAVRPGGALLAGARDRWEMEPGFAGPAVIASRDRCHVVCDATLYYVRDLESRLRSAGVVPASDSAADLILAAYLAFGERCVEHLEGDYAFGVWDDRTRTLFCARDPFGIRSLYYMELEGTLYVASTTHPLVRRQGSRAAFDRRGLLRGIIVRPGDGSETAWQGIRELPGAHTMRKSTGELDVRRFWRAAPSPEWTKLDFAEAGEALAELLDRAAQERQQRGDTALAMSGGMDSTAVLASLDRTAVGAGGRGVDVLSYKVPEGDPANEDWYIGRTASSFDLPVHWVDVEHLDFFADQGPRAELRSEAPGHLFESYNRALAWKARELGDRVLMNGHGGDNLFSATDVGMADLLRQGRLLYLRRYFRDRHYRGAREAITHVLRPALPLGVFDVLETMLGRHICSRPWERPWPPWVVAEPELLREIVHGDREGYDRTIVRHHSSVLARHRAWAMMDCVFQDICTQLFDFTREEGVELRMPFFDKRLVAFAMSRPVDELNQPGRRKLVLERAVAGRLPERTREPQAGLKPGSFVGMMQSCWTPQAARHLETITGPWVSEELGLVDPEVFFRTLEERGGPHWSSARDTSLTMFCETWLRVGRDRIAASAYGTAAASG